MKSNILWLVAGVALCAVVLGGFLLWRAVDMPLESQRVDDAIVSVDVTMEESRKVREILTKETTEKVVIIREQVREEVLALGPDQLAVFARNEIDLFRGGGAGGRPDPSAAGVDGE